MVRASSLPVPGFYGSAQCHPEDDTVEILHCVQNDKIRQRVTLHILCTKNGGK